MNRYGMVRDWYVLALLLKFYNKWNKTNTQTKINDIYDKSLLDNNAIYINLIYQYIINDIYIIFMIYHLVI